MLPVDGLGRAVPGGGDPDGRRRVLEVEGGDQPGRDVVGPQGEAGVLALLGGPRVGLGAGNGDW